MQGLRFAHCSCTNPLDPLCTLLEHRQLPHLLRLAALPHRSTSVADIVAAMGLAASRKLRALGVITVLGESTGRKIQLTEADEDALDAVGVKTGHLNDLVRLGVVKRA